MLSIRPARAGDVPTLNTLIHEFAEFERLPVAASEASLLRDGFGERAQISRADGGMGRPGRRLCAVLRLLLHLRGPSPDSFSRTFTFAASIAERELAKRCWPGSASAAREKNCFGVRWQVLDWNTPAIDFYKSLGATFLDDWKTVSLDGDALAHVARRERR